MKVVEAPVKRIESAENFEEIGIQIPILARSLKHIFDISNFYKEVRMVSFLDRLLQCVLALIQKRCSLARALREACQGPRAAKDYIKNYLDSAQVALQKYEDSFFLRDLMEEKSGKKKVENALGVSDEKNEEQMGAQQQ